MLSVIEDKDLTWTNIAAVFKNFHSSILYIANQQKVLNTATENNIKFFMEKTEASMRANVLQSHAVRHAACRDKPDFANDLPFATKKELKKFDKTLKDDENKQNYMVSLKVVF